MGFRLDVAQKGLDLPPTWEQAIRAEAQGDWSRYALIKGIASQESGWNPNAYRAEPQYKWPDGSGVVGDASYGLMQVLFSTAIPYGTGKSDDLFDPVWNIHVGSAYLASLIANSSELDAVARYNAGTARKNDLYQYINGKGGTNVQAYVDSVEAYTTFYMNHLPLTIDPAAVEASAMPTGGSDMFHPAAPAAGLVILTDVVVFAYAVARWVIG